MAISDHDADCLQKRFMNLSRKPSMPVFTSNPTPADSMTSLVETGSYQQPSPQTSLSEAQYGGMDFSVDMEPDFSDDFDMHQSTASPRRDANWSSGPGPALHHVYLAETQQRSLAPLESSPESNCATSRDDIMIDSVPRGMQNDTDWYNVQNRRLPSPLSDTDDSSAASVSLDVCVPDMILDNGIPSRRPMWETSNETYQRGDGSWAVIGSASPVSQRGTRAAWYSDLTLDTITIGHACNHEATSDTSMQQSWHDGQSSPHSPSANRKGHARSRHTLGSPSTVPSISKTLSMGYRTDCDKCRDRVPGHYNHFLGP